MTQLIGRNCVICGDRITSILDGEFCDHCGNSVHRHCRENYTAASSSGSASRCPRCGGDPAKAPRKPPSGTDNRSVIWAGAVTLLLVAVVVVAYLAWPGSDAPDAGPVSDDSVEQAEREGTPAANPVVEIQTTMGTIRAELFRDKAPETVENFVDLVRQGFYDGIIFHRVIDQFMIQTGDPRGDGTGGREDKGLPAKFLRDEFHPDLRHNSPGILSMANSGPNTGDTQFFITTVPTPWLDNKHAIFGKVIEGLDVVHKIEKVPTDGDDRPVEEVRMTKLKIESGE